MKWRGEATVVYYFEAPDRRTAERWFDKELNRIPDCSCYRNNEVEEIDEKEWEREVLR